MKVAGGDAGGSRSMEKPIGELAVSAVRWVQCPPETAIKPYGNVGFLSAAEAGTAAAAAPAAPEALENL